MTDKILGGARGAIEAAAGVARHVLWYFSYQLDGSAGARDDGSAEKLTAESEKATASS